jgi:hypothetical protein
MTLHQKLDRAKAATAEYMAGVYPDRKYFIVGGALRDTDLGAEMKDVDIFVSGYDTDPDPMCEDDGERNAYLMRAYTVDWKGFELNIIFLRGDWTLERVTDRCDFGICQIGYDPVTRLTYRSPAYESDFGRNELTLCRDTVPERQMRMERKFPLFNFRNPQHHTVSQSSTNWHYDPETGMLDQRPTTM